MTTEAYAINARTLGASNLTQGEWASAGAVISHGGKLLLAETDGLFEAAGTSNVAGKLTTGKLILNNGAPFNIFKVVPFIRATAKVVLTLTTFYRGTETDYGPFSFALPSRDDLRPYPVDVGRGHRGSSYIIDLSCTGQWECRGIEIYYLQYTQRP